MKRNYKKSIMKLLEKANEQQLERIYKFIKRFLE